MGHGAARTPPNAFFTGTGNNTSVLSLGTPSTNTGHLRLATGATTYRVFAATVDSTTQCKTHKNLAYRCVACPSTGPHIIPDDEDYGETQSAPDPLIYPQANRLLPGPVGPTTSLWEVNLTELTNDEVLPPVNIIEPDEELISTGMPQDELLHWRYRLGHLPFSRLRILALLDIIPWKLSLCENTKMFRMPLWGHDQTAMALGRQASQ